MDLNGGRLNGWSDQERSRGFSAGVETVAHSSAADVAETESANAAGKPLAAARKAGRRERWAMMDDGDVWNALAVKSWSARHFQLRASMIHFFLIIQSCALALWQRPSMIDSFAATSATAATALPRRV